GEAPGQVRPLALQGHPQADLADVGLEIAVRHRPGRAEQGGGGDAADLVLFLLVRADHGGLELLDRVEGLAQVEIDCRCGGAGRQGRGQQRQAQAVANAGHGLPPFSASVLACRLPAAAKLSASAAPTAPVSSLSTAARSGLAFCRSPAPKPRTPVVATLWVAAPR